MNRWVVSLLAIAALFVAGAGFSEAAFVGASANPGSSFATAASFSTVTMTDPGTNLRGTVTLGATTTGAIVSVTIQHSPAGLDTWADACTDTTSPYSCSFDTTTVTDGLHDFRATADDGQTIIASSVVASRRIDNSAPTGVTMANPGSPIAGSVTFSGSATDAGSGVASLAFQYSPAGLNAWSDACTDATAPYSCSFDTATLADGLYDFRSLATDVAGNPGSSTVWANGRVDNYFPSSTMTDPGAYLRGTVTLAATAADDGGILDVVIQRSPAGLDTWIDVCTDTASPYSCSFDTMSVTDGLYDFRAVATDNAARSTVSTVVASRRVDNAAPAAGMTDPGAYLRGTISLDATASDGSGSGVASVTIQRSPAGLGAWTDVCTDTTSPYACSFDTTTVTDGLYDLRAVATDAAGNSTSSTVVAGRRVDNTSPTVSLTDPGAYLRLTVTLDATASDGGSGVASVTIQRSPAGLNTWTDVCTDTTSSYSCSFDTTTVTDGLYDFRAAATDAAGNSTSSTVVASRTVDNTAPTAVTVQTANAGATAGRPETNDTVTFTYSETIDPASILAGWNGTAQAVMVRLIQGGGGDRLEVWNAGDTAKLPLTSTYLSLSGDYTTGAGATFTATMVQSGASITVTLGTLSGSVRTETANGTMSWPPSATATDFAGNACSTATANESGAADREF